MPFHSMFMARGTKHPVLTCPAGVTWHRACACELLAKRGKLVFSETSPKDWWIRVGPLGVKRAS